MWCGTRWCHQSSYWPKYLQKDHRHFIWIYENTPGGRCDKHHHVLLTFERRVQNSLFDLGVLDHVGSRLGEDELPRPRFETIPVIFNHWDTVLQKHRVKHSQYVFDLLLNLLWVINDCITLMCSLRIIWRTLMFMSWSPTKILNDWTHSKRKLLCCECFWYVLILVSTKGWATLWG